MTEFPDISIEKVDVLENPEVFRGKGLRRYPALVHEEKILSVFFLTKRKIRRFLRDI